MTYQYDKISERDIDMLVFSAFVSEKHFSDIFIKKIADVAQDYTVCGAEVSKTDANLGESDLTFIIESRGEKIGILVEDKIDAVAQPEQPERYVKRGHLGIKNGDYQRFEVFILCPEKYRAGNIIAQKYDHFVSYEECLSFFVQRNDALSRVRASQLERAISIAKNPHNVILNDIAVESFKRYAEYKDLHYPGLHLATKVGNNGYWPQFRATCGSRSLMIFHKTNKHCVDLTIPEGSKKTEMMESICTYLNEHKKAGEKQISVAVTGSSAAFRIIVPEISMTKPFEEWEDCLPEIFSAVAQLEQIAALLGKVGQILP